MTLCTHNCCVTPFVKTMQEKTKRYFACVIRGEREESRSTQGRGRNEKRVRGAVYAKVAKRSVALDRVRNRFAKKGHANLAYLRQSQPILRAIVEVYSNLFLINLVINIVGFRRSTFRMDTQNCYRPFTMGIILCSKPQEIDQSQSVILL